MRVVPVTMRGLSGHRLEGRRQGDQLGPVLGTHRLPHIGTGLMRVLVTERRGRDRRAQEPIAMPSSNSIALLIVGTRIESRSAVSSSTCEQNEARQRPAGGPRIEQLRRSPSAAWGAPYPIGRAERAARHAIVAASQYSSLAGLRDGVGNSFCLIVRHYFATELTAELEDVTDHVINAEIRCHT